MDVHGLVEPLSESYVAVKLDYWQIFEGNNSTQPGPFMRRYGFKGIDAAAQVVLDPSGNLITAHRSWKNGNGMTRDELTDIAAKHRRKPDGQEVLRLSWFLIDPFYYQQDLGDNSGILPRYCSANGGVTEARKIRRPLIRVDGAALQMLETHQEFLTRHLRQFWWQKGAVNAPARLIVLNPYDVSDAAPNELIGDCRQGRTPSVMAVIDLTAGVDLEQMSPTLDECWRRFMAKRPSNADNLTFRKEQIPVFKSVDAHIASLAEKGLLFAPGGRELKPVPSEAEGIEQGKAQ
jgi:hypothetical protein